ncbi:MAG: hypothetical protein NVS2B7_32970 [Herpetosiphon sp.]
MTEIVSRISGMGIVIAVPEIAKDTVIGIPQVGTNRRDVLIA